MSRNTPLNILIAEDEASVAFSICFALRPDGHKIETVTDGDQAFAKLIAEPGTFDLLITDNNMPRMTGLQLVKRLRGSGLDCKILVLSAHLSAENRAAYEALQVNAMIPKPFDIHELRTAINRIGGEGFEPIPLGSEPLALPPEKLCRLLRLGLSEGNEPEEFEDN